MPALLAVLIRWRLKEPERWQHAVAETGEKHKAGSLKELFGDPRWRKNALVLSRGDYHWQHEPILYGWKPGAPHRWFGGRDKTTIQEFDGPPFQQVGEREWQIVLGETTLIVRGDGLTIEPVRGTVFYEDKPAANPENPGTPNDGFGVSPNIGVSVSKLAKRARIASATAA